MLRAEGLEVHRSSPGQGSTCALRAVSLWVGPGELGLVLGRSGAGKTTLLEALAGLLRLAAGTVAFSSSAGSWRWGRGEAGPAGARRRIGVLFQYPERQLFGATALEDVAWGLGPAGEGPARRALRRVELRPEVWGAPLRQLSRGEKRRVALAGVLAREPEVLLLDEPAVGLDLEGQELLRREVDVYRRERGAAVLVASHWPEAWLSCSGAVLCLDAGAPIFAGPVAALPDGARANPEIARLLPFGWRLRLALDGAKPPWSGGPADWVGEARGWLGTRTWG